MSGERRETRIIRCPSCGRYYRLAGAPPAAGTRLRCTKCGTVFPFGAAAAPREAPPAAPLPSAEPPAEPAVTAGPRLLVATDGPEFQGLIGEIFATTGYELREAREGEEAWEALRVWRPHVALLDVGLPGVPAFELCDRVRSDAELAGTGLILLASVFQQTRYKRAPTSLYGADDYIEKHHVRDWLPAKVARLLPSGVAPATGGDAAPTAPPVPPAAARPAHEERLGEREQKVLIREEQLGSRAEARQSAGRLRENLRRYARIIVSDIALYNEELVERGIREGSFHQLLRKELDEGHRLYLARVPAAAAAPSEEYWREAVREFIARRSAPGVPRGGEGGRDGA